MKDSRELLKSIPSLIEKTFPMPGRFHHTLPSQVAELSRLLTAGRGDRTLSYMNRPQYLSAYLRYFFPWNLYRLFRLLPDMNITLNKNDRIIDLGSGPLTFVNALWISRPDLRDVPLDFLCIDRSAPALEAGKILFNALSGSEGGKWRINLIRLDLNINSKSNFFYSSGNPVTLVSAINLFNEMYESIPHSNTAELRQLARNAALFMHGCAEPYASILTMEPGVPHSGRFINLLRSSFLELGRPPVSPCLHFGKCPFPGGKQRWCHFAFDTKEAPKELHILSAAAKLPKERLVLSYMLTGGVTDNIQDVIKEENAVPAHKARVISDPFPLLGRNFGRYCCSPAGLVLLAGERTRISGIESGSVVPFKTVNERDSKSGALIVYLND